VSDPTSRFAGNNLACQNCHLQAGRQPFATPLAGVWGQFPQYRAREGAVVALEDRINGCMERSMNGRALPLDSREMRAFSAYMRWLSTGIPDGAKLVGAGTLRFETPLALSILVMARRFFPRYAPPATARMDWGSTPKMEPGISFRRDEHVIRFTEAG